MSSSDKRKAEKNSEFWRATRFLLPYRHLVVISIIAAFFVGAVATAGTTAILPILQVLLNHDKVSHWTDRQLAAGRLGVKFGEELEVERVAHVDKGPAKEAGIHSGDVLANGRETIAKIADPSTSVMDVTTEKSGSHRVKLRAAAWWSQFARQIAARIPANPVWAITVLLGGVVGLAVVANSIRYFQEHYSDKAAILAVNDIRRKLYDHALHIPLGFFGKAGTSDITSRLVQDSQGLQDGFKVILGQAIQEPIKAAMFFSVALYKDWRLTAFIVLFAPLMMAIIKKFGKKVRRATRAALQSSSSMLGQIEGTLNGIRAVKTARAERFERRRYSRIMDGLVEQQLKMSRYEAISTPTVETLTLIVVSCVVIFAAYLICVKESLDTADFFLIMACLIGIGESLRKVAKLNNVLQRSNAAAARLFETLDVPVERPRHLESKRNGTKTPGLNGHGTLKVLPPLEREIHFQDVSFAYPGSPNLALDSVSLKVPKGQSVAVVGRNGSGKTTLLALLPRFYDGDSGTISIDGINIRNATLHSLRRQIAVVTQDSVVFPGTIAENIAYGQPLASREAIISAAKRAFAHDFIMEKPLGYDAPLEGLGGQLSGGQKQRLCIARAILRNAPILVLDEATSQVDAESEHLIQQAIESLMHERTTFVIAHRFSTILSADTIVVMDRGRIVGQGQHKDLLANCEIYRQLYERQLFGAGA